MVRLKAKLLALDYNTANLYAVVADVITPEVVTHLIALDFGIGYGSLTKQERKKVWKDDRSLGTCFCTESRLVHAVGAPRLIIIGGYILLRLRMVAINIVGYMRVELEVPWCHLMTRARISDFVTSALYLESDSFANIDKWGNHTCSNEQPLDQVAELRIGAEHIYSSPCKSNVKRKRPLLGEVRLRVLCRSPYNLSSHDRVH